MFLGSSWHQTTSASPEAPERRDETLERKRIELLDPQQIHVVDAAFLAFVEEIVIDLARTQNDPANVFVGFEDERLRRRRFGVVEEQPLKARGHAHFAEPRDGALMAQQRFRGHQHQRLAEASVQLTAKDMEVVRRRRAIGHLHIVFGAQLQIALKPRGGMFRTLSLVAVRQAGRRVPTCAATCVRPMK